jgi:hypothetical protein
MLRVTVPKDPGSLTNAVLADITQTPIPECGRPQ